MRPASGERPSCKAFPENADHPSHWASAWVAPGSSTTAQWPGSTSRGWMPSTTLSAARRPSEAGSSRSSDGAAACAHPVESAPLARMLAAARVLAA